MTVDSESIGFGALALASGVFHSESMILATTSLYDPAAPGLLNLKFGPRAGPGPGPAPAKLHVASVAT